MSDTFKCAWCGRHFEKSGGSKFLSGASLGLSDFGKKYCSKSCEQAAEESKNGPKSSSSNNFDSKGANQSGGETTVVNKSPVFLSILASQMDDSAERAAEREEKAKLEGKIDSVAAITFGSNVDDITNQLNQLVTLGSAKPDKVLKNAIIEKIEFGIMKLKGLNAIAEADFFQKKLDPLKKKGWF